VTSRRLQAWLPDPPSQPAGRAGGRAARRRASRVTAAVASKVFRTPRWLVWLVGVTFVASAVATGLALRLQGASLLGVGLGAFCLFALIGLFDALLTRVELHEDAVVVVRSFRRRTIPRAEIERVTWAWGGPVSLLLVDGSRVHLPDTGNSQSRTNTIRAWLQRTAGASEPADDGGHTFDRESGGGSVRDAR